MNFDGDAFISYAHLDNAELVEGRKGWVANLHRALEVRVGQLLGKSPHIWRDPKLGGNDLFADTLVDKLKEVALLVPIISPRYLKSAWTIRELNEFWKAAEAQGGVHVSNKSRVFKVLKTPVPLDKTPPEIRGQLGYEFFKIDPETGKVRELDEIFGPEAHRDFWIKLDDLAHDIVTLLEAIEGSDSLADATLPDAPVSSAPVTAEVRLKPDTTAAQRSKGLGILAETTSDLREQREALSATSSTGIRSPSRSTSPVFRRGGGRHSRAWEVPHVDPCHRQELRPRARRCTQSMVELQHELATERSTKAASRGCSGFPPAKVDDERQLKLVERIRVDPRIKESADLLETYFEDLRTTMEAWLKKDRTPAPPPALAAADAGAPRKLYLLADQRDSAILDPWIDGLFAEGIDVIQPIFEGDEAEVREYHEENLVHCDGVLILYGAANQLWLQRKLRELQKAPGYGRTKPPPPVAICLVGPRTPEKERFRTHEALVAPQWDGFALGPLQLFITQLKAGGSV